jgi:hypothetical protein
MRIETNKSKKIFIQSYIKESSSLVRVILNCWVDLLKCHYTITLLCNEHKRNADFPCPKLKIHNEAKVMNVPLDRSF